MNLRKKLIMFFDCGYWIFVAIGWVFKAIAEVFSAASGLLKEFDSEK